jgi:5-bromo-4-chloroindolyl phosphate hydrolysis protein
MAEAAAQVLSLPKALNKLSEEQRDSVRSWVEEMLKEWGELGDNDFEYLQKNFGLQREDSQQLADYLVDTEDIMPCVDLETKTLKISKSTYELGRVLGTGKYAEVRKGRNIETRKPYA